MSIQTEQHDCDAKPQYVYVTKYRIDGEWTQWTASFSPKCKDGYASVTMYITHCPFCGKELEHG